MIETIALVLTGLGLIASIVYYANILNNANKTRELQLEAQKQTEETRQAQLFMNIYNQHLSERESRTLPLLMDMEYDDFEDF